MELTKRRRQTTADDSVLALAIGQRIRAARLRAGMTQQQVAEGRYTKAYISALETGHAKPSMAALNFIAARLGVSAPQLMAANDLRWSRLEADLLLSSGRWDEAVDAYAELLAGAMDQQTRAEILRGRAEALCRLGRATEAIRPATEAMEQFRALGRSADEVNAGYWLAYALYLSENPAEARSVLRTLIDAVRSGIDVEPDMRMRLLTAAAYVETWEGKHQAAVSFLEEARALGTDLDDRRRASFLSALATAYYDGGDLEGAIRFGGQSLALFRAAEAHHEMALVGNNLANAYLAMGNLSRAAELVADAHREHELAGDEHELATVLDTEARVRLARGDVDGAVELAMRAMRSAEAAGNQKALTDAQVTLARAAMQAGRPQEAIAAYESAAGRLRQHGPQSRLAEVLGEWADVAADQGDHERAYSLTREALTRVTHGA